MRAVVLTGAGRAFCAGADLTTFAEEIDFDDAHMVRDRLRFVGSVVNKWVKLDKPTIAAVNGIAIGGGCNLALMCDLVLMREDATIGQTYVQRGLVMDMGGTYFLPRLVGRALANELALFGDAISAAEAARDRARQPLRPRGGVGRRRSHDWGSAARARRGPRPADDQDRPARLAAARPRRDARVGGVRDRDDLPDGGPARVVRGVPGEAQPGLHAAAEPRSAAVRVGRGSALLAGCALLRGLLGGAEPFAWNSSSPAGSGANWPAVAGRVGRAVAREAGDDEVAVRVRDVGRRELAARPVPLVDPVHHPEHRDRRELRLDVGADESRPPGPAGSGRGGSCRRGRAPGR